MPADDHLIDGVADAILDGTPIDWAAVEAHVDGQSRPLLDRLRMLAAFADAHRDPPHASPTRNEDPDAPRAGGGERDAPLKRWGHLVLVEEIGRGTFGKVYRARDTRLDRDVALKLLPAHSASGEARAGTIIEEGRLLAQVRHPNVVTIHGAERINDQVGLSMELVNGSTLEQVLEQGRSFTVHEVVQIGLQLCAAIAAVHDAGLLHRDIKCHNVMWTADGRVVLMDFGTGHDVREDRDAGLAGTPLYMAPELLSGQPPSVRSDIYSLGVLLYHLLTGSYPVRASTLNELRVAHEQDDTWDVTMLRLHVTSKLARIIERAIGTQPERRYPSVNALRQDLAALKPRPRVGRLLRASGAAAAIVMVVLIGMEAIGRRVGWATLPFAWLATMAGVNPLISASIAPAGQAVIAVLPLENLSPEADNGFLADALTDGIIRDLALVQGLHVLSRTSSSAFKDKPRNVREVGELLGATLIVEGSVMQSGNRLSVDVRLVEIAGERYVWADRFDRGRDDILAIQDEISRAIADRLRLKLRSAPRRYDLNIDTYILYLKARAQVGRRGPSDAKAAVQLFQQVIEKDRVLAPAYAGLAEAYGLMSHSTLSSGIVEAAHPLMKQAAEKALDLDPLLAEGHAAMGFIYAREYDWQNAQKSFRRAIALNPTLTQTYINYWTTTLLPQERLDEAEPLLQVAMRTDPLSPTVHGELGFLKLVAGRFDEAIEHYMRARALDANVPYLDQHLGRALTFAGKLSEALSWWDSRTDLNGKVPYRDLPGGQPWIAAAYVKAGRRAEVERWAEVHDEPYRLALIHAALGDKDRTFAELDRAAEIVPHRVVPLLAYPEMRLLRGDPRLAALRNKLRLP